MGRIRVLSDQVANQIAAGEVVERPASVVKELLENSLDAGATRIRIEVEGGGRKLIRIVDDGQGMVRDDALLAFERHATSKLHSSDDLLAIRTLGFRGEALPSIASVSRLTLDTRAAEEEAGTTVEIAGGKILRVEDAGLPVGTTIAVRDLFYNTPARRKFLKSEQTELGHIAALVTHYALAHPERHFELHSATQALLIAPAVATSGDRLFQIFGRETAALMLPIAAEIDFARAGLPEPPPWKREADYAQREPGFLRLSGFVSKPELQKLNRNSVYVFVNQRLVRDRVVLHALAEAYRNIIPPTSFPVVLLFLEMPPQEVDVNVHPAKTEVRFRQSGFVHDFIRDSVRTTLMTARPAASFATALGEMHGGVGIAQASSSLLLDVSPMPGAPEDVVYAPREVVESEGAPSTDDVERFSLRAPVVPPSVGRFAFGDQGIAVGYQTEQREGSSCGSEGAADVDALGVGEAPACAESVGAGGSGSGADGTLNALATLKPLGQLRDSFILAANDEGLWIIDQHVAHERVLFEKMLPAQMVSFAAIARELDLNGFEAEPFGPRTLAIKAAPVGLEGRELERMLEEVLAVPEKEQQQENAEMRRRRIAASIACHAAIKINMPLEPTKIAWLLAELAKTEHPMSCPHGRPIALRYSHKDIQRAFQRI
jgi:DNA mismatch repair protein MutL